MTKNNITELKVPETEIKEGSVVKLKSSGPLMTVCTIRTLYMCEYFHEDSGTFMSSEFFGHELDLLPKK